MTNTVTEQQKEAEAHRLWELYQINNRDEYFWRMAEHSLANNLKGMLYFHIAFCLMQRGLGLPDFNWHGPNTVAIYLGGWADKLDIRHPYCCDQLATITINEHFVYVRAIGHTPSRLHRFDVETYAQFTLADPDPHDDLVDRIEKTLAGFAEAFYPRGER